MFTVVSPLAEGADRLVAREVLRTQDARLEAVLPFPRDEYLLDFEEAASRADFEDLLADADRVDEQPGGPSPDPDEAYARVGQAVVDRSDILIAIWDGRPARGHGGTAEIVDYARRQGRPVVLIPPEAGELKLEPGHGPPSQMVARLDQFNRESIQRSTTAKLLQEARSAFCGPKQTAALGHTEAEALSEWIAPYFARADYLANRYRFWFYRLTDLLYLAASAAVAVVAVQSFFFHEHFWIVWSEVVLLVVLLGVVVYGRRVRLQRRWLSNRFLAERLRSAFYLAAIGTAERGESTFAGADTADEWIQGALLEVWNRRPTVTRKQPEPLRGLLADAWIEEQVVYYATAARNHGRRHRLAVQTVYVLFAVTIGAAIAHSLGAGEDHAWGHIFSALCITLPAIAAALTGLAAQRDYMRNSEQFARAALALELLQERLRAAPDLETIRQTANEVEATLRDENRSWLGLMRFHDFELHV